MSSASGRTASAAPSKSLFSTKRAGSRGPGRVGLGAAGTKRAKGSGYNGFALHSVSIDRHSRRPIRRAVAGPSPWPSRRSASNGKLREKAAGGPRGDNGPRDDKATPVLHLDAPSHDVSSPLTQCSQARPVFDCRLPPGSRRRRTSSRCAEPRWRSFSTGAIQPNVMTLSTGKSTRAGDPRPRRLRIEAAALLISAEEAPSRSEPKRSDDARHTFATGANSDRAIFAALASPHGLRQNDRC